LLRRVTVMCLCIWVTAVNFLLSAFYRRNKTKCVRGIFICLC
jgi:hypothetical protein